MTPAARRRGALALLALAGCGVAQQGCSPCDGSDERKRDERQRRYDSGLDRTPPSGRWRGAFTSQKVGHGWNRYELRFEDDGTVTATEKNEYLEQSGRGTWTREGAFVMNFPEEVFTGTFAREKGMWRIKGHFQRNDGSDDGPQWEEYDESLGSNLQPEPEEPGAASGGLREALDGALRLRLVAAGSDDALRFDHAGALREGGEAPLSANGKNVGLYWSQPRNAWGHWDYIDLGVSEKLRPLRVKFDGPSHLGRVFIVWNGPHGEFVFDVSMWQLHEGQHLVLVKACEGNPGGPTRMSKDAAGRDFVLHADGTIGPRTATHLRLGVVSKIGNLRPGWSAHEDIDMAYQGDVEIIDSWRATHSVEDLQRIVERKGYSAISVGSFDHAALKKFPYQLTADHCEPSPGYSNTFYIWDGRGGGGGSGADDESAEEAARLDAERLEAERLEAERLDAERLEAERLEAERLEGALGIISSVQPKKNGEGSGGSLGKVEVGRVMSWYDYRARAKQEGGRLPTTAELRAAGVDVGYDQWTPITPSPGDQETGRRDGARGKDENAWANIGPRKYQIEYPAWGLDASEHPWKRLTYFYVVSDFGKDWDGFEDDESGALGIISSVQPKIIDSRLVLVRRGGPNVLRFDHWQALQAGGAAPLTCDASHPGNGIGTMYPEERRFQEWRYTESKCVAARDACSVRLVQGKFLKRVDANLVLDVAFWKFHEGTAVNWVGGGSDDRTYLHGGGRDFRVNSDGSICLVNHPRLCLGVIDPESRVRLFRWRRWLSKVQGVCSNDWPEFPGDYPYEAFANSGKCRGGDFDEDVGTVADIGECWSRCQDLNEPGKTSYCASMHQTSMECSCQGADPDGDFDELECLEDVGEYTLAVHEGWRGSRCYGNDGRVCACDGGDYCLPCDYCLPWTREHMAGPFKEGLLSYAFLAIGFSLLLGPGVSLKARVGLCWVAIPGLMAVVAVAIPGTAIVAFLCFLVGIIVYRCIKGCADVVARIEAIESTIQVMQNPPPPRHGLLNMYSGEIGICVLLIYFFGLYQHSL